MFAASFTLHARGVMTLTHNSVPFQVTNGIKDKFGRYLIDCTLFTENLNLNSLPEQYVIAGDWNCTLNPVQDRSEGADQTHNSRTTVHHFIKELKFHFIHHFIKELNLLDIWKHLKPNDVP